MKKWMPYYCNKETYQEQNQLREDDSAYRNEWRCTQSTKVTPTQRRHKINTYTKKHRNNTNAKMHKDET
jgi:hypothetical protein